GEVLGGGEGGGVGGEEGGREGGRLAQALERGGGPAGVPRDAERGRKRVPPGPHHADCPGWLVRVGDGGDPGFIGRPRWLDRVPVAGGGEERLPPGRGLGEVEQVGGVAP